MNNNCRVNIWIKYWIKPNQVTPMRLAKTLKHTLLFLAIAAAIAFNSNSRASS